MTAIAWIALGTLYLSDYRWIGDAFLRYDWLALCGDRRRAGAARPARSPAASRSPGRRGVRVFPGFLVAAVVLHAAHRPRAAPLAAGSPPAHRRFALGCLLAHRDARAALGRGRGARRLAGLRREQPQAPGDAARELRRLEDRRRASIPPRRRARCAIPRSPIRSRRGTKRVRANFERRQPLFAAGVVGFVALLVAALARDAARVRRRCSASGSSSSRREIGAYYYALLALLRGPRRADGRSRACCCCSSRRRATASAERDHGSQRRASSPRSRRCRAARGRRVTAGLAPPTRP